MRWSYKTVHYELQKEGLLGNAFLDESEVEKSLNEYGKAGWELVTILETMDGLIAVFKQSLSYESDVYSSQPRETAVDKKSPRAVNIEEDRVSVQGASKTAAEPPGKMIRERKDGKYLKQTERSTDADESADVGSIRIE